MHLQFKFEISKKSKKQNKLRKKYKNSILNLSSKQFIVAQKN